MNLLLDPGMLPVNELEKTFEIFINGNNTLHLVSKKVHEEYWKTTVSKFESIHYNYFNIQANPTHEGRFKQYSKIIDVILNDSRTILIAERVNKLKRWGSAHNAHKEIEKIVFNIIAFLKEKEINCVIFQATPHGIYEWLLGKTAEGLGVKVLMMKTSPIPWRYWMIEGIDKQKPIDISHLQSVTEDKYLDRYIAINTSTYSQAIPDYEKKRIEARGGQYWSWKNEFQHILKRPRPRQIRELQHKYNLYKSYKRHCSNNYQSSKKNIVFFLHYQPERTSLPEGGIYAQQWLIARALSLALPDNWILYVKEHPSIFTNTKFDYKYRDENFYSEISKLHNVELVPLQTDTFDLIDNSMGIATITGTVGVQSLLRGKSVLAFGCASYAGCPGVYKIESINDLEEAFNNIKNNHLPTIDESSTRKFLTNLIPNTVSCIDDRDGLSEFSFYDASNRKNGHLVLLSKVLNTPLFTSIIFS